jgi:Peptidase family S41
MKKITFLLLAAFIGTSAAAQSTKTISLPQQQYDFKIFKTSVQEMHAGLHWFITPERFNALYDSVYNTLTDSSSTEAFYIKLRYCMAMLHHGHGGINMQEKEAGINYRMDALPKSRKHLPFQLKYLGKRLYILCNGSSNKQITNGSEILSINGESVADISAQLLPYIFANGKNETFKYAMLGDYFQFQYFYQILHPDAATYALEIIPFKQKKKIRVVANAELPQTIADAYLLQTGKKISDWGKLIEYKLMDAKKKLGYVKFETFSAFRIENDSTKFPALLESIFVQIKKDGVQNLVVDVRNNEGGDDNWMTSLTYFKGMPESKGGGLAYVQSDKFTQLKYVEQNEQNKMLLQAFQYNPYALLDKIPDGRFKLKPQYTGHDTKAKPRQANAYDGKVYVLQNGLTFSAGIAFVTTIKDYYNKDGSFIKFIGEEPGDDMAAGVGSGGWSLNVILPNSKVKLTIPVTGGGTDKPYTIKPVKIPDYKVIPTIADKMNGVDTELEFVKRMIK